MAKTNKLKLANSFIEAEITESISMINSAATRENYGKALEYQRYKEGLEKALAYLKVAEGNKNDTVPK
ncbi:MAG: hypothetical protein IT212_12830 [Bacteroidia bacterium]|nr:hypothetical protein [Bacteroidia bacterium]